MIRVGIVGLGFMGWMHWLAYQKLRGVRIAAVSDRNAHRLRGDFRDVRGNFGPPGKKVKLDDASAYLDWQDLVRDPLIDLVDITLPTSLHAKVAIAAFAAGKHVLCEKPMALAKEDCQRMMRAAKRAGRMLLVAHVLPFFPDYAWALNVVRSGKYGKVRRAWLKREISEPTWSADYWTAGKIGGPMFDLHVHDSHFVRLLLGKPSSARAAGTTRNGLPKLWSWSARYPDRELIVHGNCGVLDNTGWTFNHGVHITFEEHSLKFDFAVIDGQGHYFEKPVILHANGRMQRPKLTGGEPLDAFIAELREAIRCVRSGTPSPVLNAELAADAVRICHAEWASLKSGRSSRL